MNREEIHQTVPGAGLWGGQDGFETARDLFQITLVIAAPVTGMCLYGGQAGNGLAVWVMHWGSEIGRRMQSLEKGAGMGVRFGGDTHH